MKKILIVGLTENPGGIETVIMNYYRKIDRCKIQFDFLCTTGQLAYSSEIGEYGGKIINITGRRSDFFEYKKQINEFFKLHSKEYAAIWVNMCNITNLDYLKLAKKYNIKIRILHSHNSQNMYSNIVKIVHKINKLFVNKYATHFWSCSDEAGKWFFNNKILSSNRYLVVKNSIDTEKFRFNPEVRKKYRKELDVEDKIVIGHVGRFQKQKNHDFLIEVFKELCNINDNYTLLLIGDGEEKSKIEDKVIKYGLKDKVNFLGVRNDVEKILQAMDVFLFPSLFEGLGVALLEAEATGITVYATKDTIVPEIKMSDNMFFISLEENPKKWAQIISKNLCTKNNSDKVIKKMKANGYDISTEVKKIQRFFEEC